MTDPQIKRGTSSVEPPTGMDPQVKSLLTTVGGYAAMAIATWAVSKGIIPGADQSTIANDLVLFGSAAAAAIIAWYKRQHVSQEAMIKSVNASDNGVKVVPNTSPTPPVDAPIPSLTTTGTVVPASK